MRDINRPPSIQLANQSFYPTFEEGLNSGNDIVEVEPKLLKKYHEWLSPDGKALKMDHNGEYVPHDADGLFYKGVKFVAK